MRRLLVATTLGLGLLAGGGMVSSSIAGPLAGNTTIHTTDQRASVVPVHADDYRTHYAPPPRHWRRPAPSWHEHSHLSREDGYRYGWR